MSKALKSVMRFVGGGVGVGEKQYTADSLTEHNFTVADGAANEQRTVNVDRTKLQLFAVVTDQPLLMEWNDAVGTQGSEAVVAGVPFVERVAADMYHVSLFTVDVTDLFFSNSSGTTANVWVFVLQNNTP